MGLELLLSAGALAAAVISIAVVSSPRLPLAHPEPVLKPDVTCVCKFEVPTAAIDYWVVALIAGGALWFYLLGLLTGYCLRASSAVEYPRGKGHWKEPGTLSLQQ